jgi:hypothetical protein
MTDLVCRDERELQVDLAADRLTATVMGFALLAIAAYRGLVENVASWELLGVVILGGVVGLGYRLAKGVVTRGWMAYVGLSAGIAAIVAIVLGWVLDLPS